MDSVCGLYTVDKGMIYVLGETEYYGTRFYHTTQNGAIYSCELLISGTIHLIFCTVGNSNPDSETA